MVREILYFRQQGFIFVRILGFGKVAQDFHLLVIEVVVVVCEYEFDGIYIALLRIESSSERTQMCTLAATIRLTLA